MLRETKPDLALIDIAMPGLNGLELAARVTREAPGTRLVILSMHGTPGPRGSGAARRRQRLPAQGRGRRRAAGAAARRHARRDLSVARRSRSRWSTATSGARAPAAAPGADGAAPDVLTSRQREILQLVAEGKSTKEVAQLLDVSAKTVETHRGQIMERLGIHDLAGLVRYAIRTGLVSPDR